MRRREFITLMGGAAAWPLAASAQQPTPTIGFLATYKLDRFGERMLAAFREGLRETGFEEGRNVAIEFRTSEDRYDRLPVLAAEFVSRRVSVIAAAGGSPAAIAAKEATTSIPVVFQVGVDPVEIGLVASLNRPGGNVTGIANLSLGVGPKRLELMHELRPNAKVIALLSNPINPAANTNVKDSHAAARTLGVTLQIVDASSDRDFEAAFASLAGLKAGGLVIAGDPFFNSRSVELATLAMRHGVPAIYQFPEFTAAGGLISYGSNIADTHRLTGIYTGRVLKGEKPADLPVQQATKVELIINLKTAKALGLSVPTALLVRADEVIE
jgi:putative ABC transport system substrate-binding protein